MHDPMTVAFEIKSPFKKPLFSKSGGPLGPYRETWFTIWHVDPEKDGTDDSCGWFIRSRHCDKEVLEKIIKRFEYDWDRTFTSSSGHTYNSGFFKPDGHPHLSVQAVVLNLFWMASIEIFSTHDKAMRFINRNLADILLFAENPFDSLYDGITRKFEDGCNEKQTSRKRQERIRNMAGCIYSWIMRQERPWYKHPKWHIHHWKIQWHFGQKLHRWLFQRCDVCGKRFKWNKIFQVLSNWGGDGIWHMDCDRNENKVSPEKIIEPQLLALPWKKIRFKTETGHEYDGYVYCINNNKLYVSQNNTVESIGLAQNWVITKEQLIQQYEY